MFAVGSIVFCSSPRAAHAQRPTADDARQFVNRAASELELLLVRLGRAQWVQENFITHDTEILAAEANEAYTAAAVRDAKQAARFDEVPVSEDLRRKLDLLKLALTMPAPGDPALTAATARLAAELNSMYGSGQYCTDDGVCQTLSDLEQIIWTSRNPDSLLMAWERWRTVSVPMREKYERFAELMNQGARELGFRDVGEFWRSKYDLDPTEFIAELDRLWEQVKPLYDALHCYVRDKLQDVYGETVVPSDRPIPAHLLGNMWAQNWSKLFDLIAPGNADPGYDLTRILRENELSAREMARYGERFFTSLSFAPLPETFWERSLFTRPRDRDVVCHASAWEVDDSNDLRIKMCINVNAEDFSVIHHELGHNFYQRAYGHQPFLYRGSANGGFHEALGDAVALSVTPRYLVQVGLLPEEPSGANDVALLLRTALDKVAFLPFGLLVDQWRWKVFSGETAPDEYNAEWWRLREQYQGVGAPSDRTEHHFDPGAKFHVPANVSYTRYFVANILQFQFHRSLCETAGYEGPLHRCSIYGNREAGRRLQAMMEMGQSQPWPEALEALTGQREMDATAIVDYFAPLKGWLDEETRGRRWGW